MLQKASTEHTFFCCFQLAQSLELFVPSSPSESSSQDSGMGVFDDKADGDDDGFIDDFVQEQSKKVLTFMCSFFTKLRKRVTLEHIWNPYYLLKIYADL